MSEQSQSVDNKSARIIEFYPEKAVQKELDSLPERQRDKFLTDFY
ncbi:hypothetical protein [Pseudomonas chlororaphis]|nr:hypothetical protein [Pseudomonas chlororaphis]